MNFSRIARILALVLGSVVVVAVGAGLYLYLRKPAMAPASNIRVDRSEDRVARGRYLFVNLCDCVTCHSEHNFRAPWPKSRSSATT